ncbi:MAG: BACON domain-containing protein [Gemmatimonadales bacterium]
MHLRMRSPFVAVLILAACSTVTPSDSGLSSSPPPPPAPIVIAVNPLSRHADAHPGSAAPGDDAAIVLSGDGAAEVRWSAAKRHAWTTLLTPSGTGSGTVSWSRDATSLGAGTYVDTITITAADESMPPVAILDSLVVTAAPVPLALAITPLSRSASTTVGSNGPDDNVAITLSGDGAGATAWSASNRKSWNALATSVGTGNGVLTWHRNTAALAVGTYVDTITITASGAAGSPVQVFDTVHVTASPAPLGLAVTPPSLSASAAQGSGAAGGSASVALSGTNAAAATWTATRRKAWTTLTTASGTGSGTMAWSRNSSGLAAGIYVDTITVTAPGAAGSPARVIDTLRITVPLSLALSPASHSVTIAAATAAPDATATVTLSGDNAASANWSATKQQSWTTLTNASGTGSGTLAWSRNTTALAAGTYVDTITVTAAGARGSPSQVIDSVIVTPPTGGPTPDLGVLADLHGKSVLPASDPWNQPVDTAQVDPNSNLILSTIGLSTSLHPDWGPTWGFPYAVIPDNTPRVPVSFTYASESDPGPYPIPACPAIEGASVACGPGDGDSHLLVITQNEWKLYEIFSLHSNGAGGWAGGSGAIFDLTNGTQRPTGWTSADAAGLPIFPGLVRYDEVYGRGEITHALRFTVVHTRRAYVPPASHVASSLTGAQYAPMGMRVRLKASFDISGYPAPMQVILRALKKYGMMVADNGGNFYVSGTIDPRWNDTWDNLLKQVHVGDFEVVTMNGVVTQ